MAKVSDESIMKFIVKNRDLTLDELKKAVRKKFPSKTIYNEDLQNYIIKAFKSHDEVIYGNKTKDDDYER